MKLLIDGDTVLFKGLTATKDRYYDGLRACDFTLDNILARFNYPEYVLGIGGSGNFRKLIYPEYKSNRDPASLPKYLYESKQYVKKYWGAVEAHGMETDDLLAMQHDSDTVLIVQDKDFKQLGGKYYNYWKDEFYEINNPEFYWWRQCLTGDSTDCIPGLKNPAKLHHKNPPNFTDDTASKLLEGKSPEEMKDIVQGLYKEIHGDNWFEKFDLTARLLFLRRANCKEYYQWISY